MEINNNYFLPEEISIDIFSRLPIVSVIRCSLVCKAWRNLIVYNRDFARLHLLRGLESHDHGAPHCNGRVDFLLLTSLGYEKGYTLYYTLDDDDDNYEKPEPRLRVLSSNPNPYNNKNYYVVGSCNGLICMAYVIDYYHSDEGWKQPMYICNPITREWLTLPSLTINDCCFSYSTNDNNDPTSVSRYRKVVCGFGYLPSTNEYKVVRIYYCFEGESQSHVGRVQVYTLGDGTGWRDKGEITYELKYFINVPTILANGALHWLEEDEGKIVGFYLADEEFLFLPPPPCFIPCDVYENPFKIQVLGGQLCAFHSKENLTAVGVWFFKNKKNEEKNGNYKDRNGRPEYQSWSWIKEFDIKRDLKAEGYITPFILTEHGDVLYHSLKTLFCHDLKVATSKELVDMVKCLSSDLYWLAAIPHLNSFISLKALGEEDTKIIIESA